MTEERGGALRERVLNASGWTALSQASSQLLRFCGNLVMTRLLMPEAFGVMTIAWTVMYGLAMISDTGIRQCIVQSRNADTPLFLNTAWSMQIARGAILTVAALGIAGLFAVAKGLGLAAPGSVYAHSDLPLVVAAVAFSALMSGFESTKLAMAYRHLALVRVTVIDIICQVAGLVVMVGWAIVDPTIRALVVGVLIVGPIRVALSHLALPGSANRWTWDAASARELLGFGKWIFLSSLLGFLVMSGDRIILGGLTDADALGQYAIAFLIVAAMQQVIAAIIANVALPALSETYRSNPQRLKATFYRLRTPVDIALLALVGFFVAAGPWIIDLLYDERYRLAGPLIQILAISLFAVRYDVATQCYLALGKSRLIAPLLAVRLPLLFVLTPIAFHFGGLLAATWVIALVPLASIPVHLVLMQRNVILDVRREIAVLPALAAGFLGGSVLRMI